MRRWKSLPFVLAAAAFACAALLPLAPAQDKKDPPKKDDKKDFPKDKDFFKDKGKGGFGGPMGEVRKVFANYDADKNGRLDAAERKAARAELEKSGGGKFGKGGFGKGGNMGKSKPGEKL